MRFTLFEQDEELHARADLSVDDYSEAIEAHRTSRLVTFKGILQRLPRLNRVDNVTDLALVVFKEEGSPAEEAQQP